MRTDILFGILLTMLENKKISARELSHKFELSVRTIYRYVDVLCSAGVPILSSTGQFGGMSLSENYVLNNMYFNADEYQRILTSLQALPGAADDIQNKILISKIKTMSNSGEKDFVLQNDQLFVNTSGFNTFRNKMGVLQKALFKSKVLRITYHARNGEITTRDIEPHAFMLEGGVWYVYAFCRLRETFRLFKVSRIATLQTLDEIFKKKPITSPGRADTEYPDKSKTINVSMLVEEKNKLDVEEWIGIENVKKTSDGFYASCQMPFDNELISKLLSFGDGIRIIAPAELKNAVKTTLLSMLKIYES